ncbi:universal stress protein [Bacteroidia bacterium]|nr:universal stress protein [Bacteroidia bacterium]GHT62092.1 universal stress protein [Bacteroidia bacterium]
MEENKTKNILIPVDFSEYSLYACELGFNYAHDTGARVDILHAFYSPEFLVPRVFGELSPINEEVFMQIQKKAKEDLDKFAALVKERISNHQWPDVPYNCFLKNGLPEEEIVNYSNKTKPEMVIMGTRGKTRKDADLIGSVTAEVIENVKVPLLAIPENTPFRNLLQVKKVAFGTSFEQKDLVAFDNIFKRLKYYPIEYYLFHLTHHPTVWNEIKLAGIKDYFQKQYPDVPINYRIINADDLVLNVEKFVREESIDIISLTTYKRNLFARIFSPGIARKMLFHTDTPLLAMYC